MAQHVPVPTSHSRPEPRQVSSVQHSSPTASASHSTQMPLSHMPATPQGVPGGLIAQVSHVPPLQANSPKHLPLQHGLFSMAASKSQHVLVAVSHSSGATHSPAQQATPAVASLVSQQVSSASQSRPLTHSPAQQGSPSMSASAGSQQINSMGVLHSNGSGHVPVPPIMQQRSPTPDEQPSHVLNCPHVRSPRHWPLQQSSPSASASSTRQHASVTLSHSRLPAQTPSQQSNSGVWGGSQAAMHFPRGPQVKSPSHPSSQLTSHPSLVSTSSTSQQSSSRRPQGTHFPHALQVKPALHVLSSQHTSSLKPQGSHIPRDVQVNPALHALPSQHTCLSVSLRSIAPPHGSHLPVARQVSPASHTTEPSLSGDPSSPSQQS
mmetsp:Transcript_33968/g.74507  ORF Transcript_33968/g.74507 Transcript_33968/m.74507 type:complete len:378 (-) Transcript_33968:61-1194(-)